MIIDGGSFLKCNDKRGEGKRNHEFVFDGWGRVSTFWREPKTGCAMKSNFDVSTMDVKHVSFKIYASNLMDRVHSK